MRTPLALVFLAASAMPSHGQTTAGLPPPPARWWEALRTGEAATHSVQLPEARNRLVLRVEGIEGGRRLT